ncbi:uncharacterized protein STEHIDRAFT_154022 [Stereum hirsutum FP-91666 SS1]|uniref:uncharacterized protein n=1 Tax=Stereum hirsutum (strain FP-91666) TaxID=721885 RepID=UPI000440F5E4|nr:uncharacterized protein STEHIDRAFT_154022 [Stereum hirsutum FP-91666 SS1]EIM90186.1 hypothetical protein STEHIDRAFT_154022 [Stereum hirsutum FP-91666 SS1]
MNAYPNGSRVFFWDANGTAVKGVVKGTNVQADGTQVAVVQIDGSGKTVTLPIDVLSPAR